MEDDGTRSSRSKMQSHIISHEAKARALFYASADDRDTVGFFKISNTIQNTNT